MSTEQKFFHTQHGNSEFLSKEAVIKLLEDHKKFVLQNHNTAVNQVWSANYEQKRSHRQNGIY
jgi:hypothetical protein